MTMADQSKKFDTDRKLFMEALQELKKRTQNKKTVLSKKEVDDYLKNINLTDEQKELVYQYLIESAVPGRERQEEQQIRKKDMPADLPKTVFFQMYLKDLQRIVPCTEQEEKILFERLAAGDRTVIHELSDQWLPKILEIVRSYEMEAKEMEDAVQEANMGVFLALDSMLGNKKMNYYEQLQKAAKDAVETYLSASASVKDMDNSLVAKAALVYEAQKYLAEEFLRMPTIAELSQYTKLPVHELENILAMAKEE